MIPENGETRPRPESASPAANKTTNTDNSVTPETASGRDFTHERWPRLRPHLQTQPWTAEHGRRMRHLAALRCEPLADGRRDPDEHHRFDIYEVATVLAFGLSDGELIRERERLFAMGWSEREVRYRLGAPPASTIRAIG